MHEMFKIYEGKSGRIFNLRGLVSPSTYEIGLKKKKRILQFETLHSFTEPLFSHIAPYRLFRIILKDLYIKIAFVLCRVFRSNSLDL